MLDRHLEMLGVEDTTLDSDQGLCATTSDR